MTLPEKEKSKGWSWPAYLLVTVTVSFFSLVGWPLVKDWASRRLASPPVAKSAAPPKVEPAKPEPPKVEPAAKARPPEEPPPKPQPKDEPPAPKFRDVVIGEPFDGLFAKNPLLMDTPQVREFALPGGRFCVVCVVQAKLHADTAAGRVDAEKVCENRMAAALLAWKKETDTARVREVAGPGEQLSEATVTAIKGSVKTLAPVGRWTSARGDVFYMAYGEMLPDAKK